MRTRVFRLLWLAGVDVNNWWLGLDWTFDLLNYNIGIEIGFRLTTNTEDLDVYLEIVKAVYRHCEYRGYFITISARFVYGKRRQLKLRPSHLSVNVLPLILRCTCLCVVQWTSSCWWYGFAKIIYYEWTFHLTISFAKPCLIYTRLPASYMDLILVFSILLSWGYFRRFLFLSNSIAWMRDQTPLWSGVSDYLSTESPSFPRLSCYLRTTCIEYALHIRPYQCLLNIMMECESSLRILQV